MTKDSSAQRKRKHEEGDEPAAGTVVDRKARREGTSQVGLAYFDQLQQIRKNHSKTVASKSTSNTPVAETATPSSSQSSRSVRSSTAAASNNIEANDSQRKRPRTDAGDSKKTSEKSIASTTLKDSTKMSSAKSAASGAVTNSSKKKADEQQKHTATSTEAGPDRTPPRPSSSQRPPKAPFGSPIPTTSANLSTSHASSQPAKPLPRLPDGNKSFQQDSNLAQRPSYRHQDDKEVSANPEAEAELSSTLRIQQQVNDLQKLLLEEREQDELYNSEDDDFDDLDYDYEDDEMLDEDDGFPNNQWRRGASFFQRYRWLLTIGGIIAAAAVSIAIGVYQSQGGDLFFWMRASPKPRICFMDNRPGDVRSACDEDSPLVPCPQGALCNGGVIESCDLPEFYDIDNKNTTCVLSEKSNEMIALIVRKIQALIVQDYCRPAASQVAGIGNSTQYPLFSQSQLLEELELGDKVALLQNLPDTFVIQKADDESILISLNQMIKVRIPWVCRAKRLVVAVTLLITQWVLAFFWGLWRFFWGVLEFYWEIFEVTPIVTLLITFVVPAVLATFRNRRLRKLALRQLEIDCARVRERVYGCLSAVADRAVNTIDVRDQIVWSDHPMSKEDRKRTIEKVWPLVVNDIRQDNRIAKSFSMVNGTRRETWKWTAPVINPPVVRPNPVIRFH